MKLSMQLPPSDINLVKILRGLLITDILITASSLPIMLFSGIVEKWVMEQRGIDPIEFTTLDTVVAVLGIILLIAIILALIVSWIGLFNFYSWSRWLYLGTIIAGYLLYIPLSIFIFSFNWGFPEAIMFAGGPVNGAIIAIIFFSSIAKMFEAKD
ncbi:MAG: hypothetical protein WAX69_02300 [Victivallales bacterium]